MKVVWLVVAMVACRKPDPELTPPSVEEATAFANEFAKHMAPCDPAAVSRDLDIDLLMRRATAGLRFEETTIAQLRTGASQVLGDTLCEGMAPINGEGPSYSLLRVRTVEGHPQPLLRVIRNGGLNYHELTLDKQPDRIRIADVRVYSTGESMSEMFASMLAAISDPRQADSLIEAKRKLSAGDPAGARRIVMYLPKAVRHTKVMRMFDVRAAAAESEAEFLQAADEFAAAFPGDPAIELVAIEQAFLRKDLKKVLPHLDAVDRWVGGDPVIDAHRALAYLDLGNSVQAIHLAKRATNRAPDIEDTWWVLLTVQSAAKQFAPAVETVQHMRTGFHLALDAATLGADPRFQALVASPEFVAANR